MSAELAGAVTLGVYLLVMVAIGVWTSRGQHSAEDLWVGDRRFGTAVMVLGMMAAVMHGGSILSGVAFAAAFGGVAILPLMSFTLGFLVILLFFARKLRDSRILTLPDYMGDRFASRPLRAFSALVVAASSIVYLIAQIRGMGLILEALLGTCFGLSMTLGTGLFIFYVALGGITAVIWTNVAQFVFMWVGLLILMPAVYRLAGGWTSVLEGVEAAAPGWTSVLGTQWSWGYLLSWWLVWFVAYATRVELVTKLFVARDSKTARYALPTTCLLVILFLLYGNLYLGAAARLLVWDGLAIRDQAFPALVSTALGPVAAAIALTGIASAAMSTTDSLLLLSGAAVAHDLLRKCWYEPRQVLKSDAFYLVVSRVAIVAVGVVSLLLALRTPELILALVSYAVAMIGAAFFMPLLLGLVWKRTSPTAALVSSVSGFSVTLAWTAAALAKAPWAGAVHPIVPGLAVSALAILVLTPLTAPAPESALERFFPAPAGAGEGA